jgi:arylsulfatase
MGMVSRNRTRTVPCLLVALLGVSCAPEPELVPTYVDFVTMADTLAGSTPAPPEQRLCADETRFAYPLAAGDELLAGIELGVEPVLVLSGCGGGPGPLEVRVKTADGAEARHELGLPDTTSWWREEIDLAELGSGPGRLRLKTVPDEEGPLVLRDIYVRQGARIPPRETAPSQILLISIDTLREDAIGALGGGSATPNLDRFVGEAQVWSPHYATSGWTQPSHASLLTGELGWVHGAFGRAIRPEIPTLAERLRDAGFRTAGLVYDCVWLNPKFGFSRGFDEYRSVSWNLGQQVRAVTNWVAGHRDEPFFFFFHTFEVHSDFNRLPYEAPGVRVDTVHERFSVADYGCREEYCASNLLTQINYGNIAPLPEEGEILRFLYQRGVEHLDAQLGRLFDDLRALGVYDDMLIVLTSDHGESFLEHTEVMHGNWWEEVVRVPLAIKWPRGNHAGARRDVPTSAIDLMPTLLETVGLDHGDLPGSTLAARDPDAPVFVMSGEFDIVIDDGLKFICYGPEEPAHLYDRRDDPEEHRDLLRDRPADVERLTRLVAEGIEASRHRLAAMSSESVTPELTEEERERLRSLGYVQ